MLMNALLPALCRRLVLRLALFAATALSLSAAPLKVLFLGDVTPTSHQSGLRLPELAPALMARGIQLVYTDDAAWALQLDVLKRYDAFMLYGNINTITPAQEKALLDYVNEGGGFVPVHSASACFGNSPKFIALVGGKFQSHAAINAFQTTIVLPDHPIMKGFAGVVTTGDEPYVHSQHNTVNRTVLELRDNEPYTWIRTEGKGRVFYTAWGHDQRTWTNPGFQDLMARGIRYAAGLAPVEAAPAATSAGVAVFEYEESNENRRVPNYSNQPGSTGGGANPWPQIQKPLRPAQSMQHIVVPGGFELQLFASDPDIKKPIAMAWDERGRCWIVETVDYPNNLLPAGERGNDRIVICEDTNKDGKADKFTVFADGLNLPTSLAFANGGIVVQQAPDTLFLKDTNGDDKADVRQVLFTGWSRNDTHAVASNLQFGPDNWIWGTVGYSRFTGTVGGKTFNMAQAIYRFKADGSEMEQVRNTNNNTWGLGFNESGIPFASTANGNPSNYMPIAARYYEKSGVAFTQTLSTIADSSRFLPITPKVREVDNFNAYTAAAGHAVYTARSYPKEYWNRIAFVTEPAGHLVGQFDLTPNGADFRSHNPMNLFVSDDEWCAPIMAEVGPDGSVWVIDWYNYVVQHNPTPTGYRNGRGGAYENPLRDKEHGRIYRVVWKAGKPSPQPDLSRATSAQLVAALKNDNLLWRRHAQRLLVEKGARDAVPNLAALVRDTMVDEIGLNVGAIHAIWTLQGLNAIDSDPAALAAVTGALKHPSAGVRRNAVAALPHTAASANAMAAAGILRDGDAQVRLAAMLALADTPNLPEAGKALHDALTGTPVALDRWSADAAKMAGSAQAASFIAAVTPQEMGSFLAAQSQAERVLLSTAVLAGAAAGLPPGWELVQTAGQVEAARANGGRAGAHSLRVVLAGEGAAGGVGTKVKVKRGYRYELTAWVRTEGLPAAPAAQPGRGNRGGQRGGGGGPAAAGATLTMQQPDAGRGGRRGGGAPPARGAPGANQLPTSVQGTSDWTQIRVPVTTNANADEVTIACTVSLGAMGTAAGSAWFDEVTLREVGPADDSAADAFATVLNHAALRTGLIVAKPAPVPAAPSAPPSVILQLGTIPNKMAFDKAELTVKAGQTVRIVFKNSDLMQHNFVLARIGALDAVGAAADRLVTTPQGFARGFVPETADVLASSTLLNPEETTEINFTAPAVPGSYPFACTFPGHWRLMKGVLIVTP
jgi:putative membrane-bound dehydrogenase-like protein